LLIDQEACRARLAPAKEARQFLADWRAPKPALIPEQIAAVRAQVDAIPAKDRREGQIGPEAVIRQMQEQRGRVSRMVSWLDVAPSPPKEGRGA
jgi:hypothetical protein